MDRNHSLRALGRTAAIAAIAATAATAAYLMACLAACSTPPRPAPTVSPQRAQGVSSARASTARPGKRLLAKLPGEGTALHLDGEHLYVGAGPCLFSVNGVTAVAKRLDCRSPNQRIVDIVSNDHSVLFSFRHPPATNPLPGGLGAITKATAQVRILRKSDAGPGPLTFEERDRNRLYVGHHRGGISDMRLGVGAPAPTSVQNTLGVPVHSHLLRYDGAHVFLSFGVVQVKRPKSLIVESLPGQKLEGLVQAQGQIYGWYGARDLKFRLVRWQLHAPPRGKRWRGSFVPVPTRGTLTYLRLKAAVWDGSRFFAIGTDGDDTQVIEIDLTSGKTTGPTTLPGSGVAIAAGSSTLYVLTTQGPPGAAIGRTRRSGGTPRKPISQLWSVVKPAHHRR